MTKYVLNSGGIGNSSDGGRTFFNEIVKDLGNNPKILICCFATPVGDWQEKFFGYMAGFVVKLSSDIDPNFALADQDSFVEQIEWCDAIYILGGDEGLLEPILRQYDLPRIWDGKTVATNSASSNLISRYYWTSDQRRCAEGLGLLPIKFLPHFKSDYSRDDPRGPVDWEVAHHKLIEFGDKTLPAYALPEGEFIVIEQ